MPSFIAYLRKEPESGHGVEVPDVPGCVTAGRGCGRSLNLLR